MKLLLCLMFMIPLATNCGYNESKEYEKPTSTYKYQGLIDQSCNKCHKFRGPLKEGQKNRIRNGSMPPSGGLSQDTKDKLLGVQ